MKQPFYADSNMRKWYFKASINFCTYNTMLKNIQNQFHVSTQQTDKISIRNIAISKYTW